MKKVGIGCLGIIVIGFVLLVIGAIAGGGKSSTGSQQVVSNDRPGGAAPAQAAAVGDTVSKGGWQLTLNDVGPWEKFASRAPATAPQGKLVVIDFEAKNLQDRTSNFTSNDFQLQASDGRKFTPSGQTASIEKGFMVTQSVQPGLSTSNRLVFDVDPAVSEYTLQALGLQFRVPLE